MRIEIAERLKPFSHQPGIAFMLPESALRVTVWPARVVIDDLSTIQPKQVADIVIDIQGPLKGFTAVQDLEKRIITVWGHSPAGYLRYHIAAGALFIEKVPEKGSSLRVGQKIPFEIQSHPVQASLERLSLGSHKKQDWTGIQSRFDLTEILPIWFRLGQLVPITAAKGGTAALLEPIEAAIVNKDVLSITDHFRNLLLAGFDTGLTPHLQDTSHHGFKLPEIMQGSPLILLTKGFKLIRSLFIQQSNNTIQILPALPPEFHCGRICGVQCSDLGVLDIEWTKKCIRRMVFRTSREAELNFTFPREVKRFRLQRGKESSTVKAGEVLPVKANTTLYFDRFEK